MNPFNKLNQEDEDFVVGKPMVHRPITVMEILARFTALEKKADYLFDLYQANPNEETCNNVTLANAEIAEYLSRLYSPIV